MGTPGIEAEGKRLTSCYGEAVRSPMERDAEPLRRCADRLSRSHFSSAHPAYAASLLVDSPAEGKITAYLAALGFQDAASRHGLVQEILERLGPWLDTDPGETIEGRAIRATLHVIDHRLARVPGLGGRCNESMGALARAALADPRVRQACLAPHPARHGLREYEIPFPAGFVAPPVPPSLPTSMPEQHLDMPSLKGLASGWRGWLRFHHALRNTLAKIPW